MLNNVILFAQNSIITLNIQINSDITVANFSLYHFYDAKVMA